MEAVADVVEDEVIEMVEQGHFAEEVQAEMAFDVAAEAVRQILHQGLFVNAARGGPAMAFLLANALPQRRRQLPTPHPPLPVADAQLHLRLLGGHGL